MLRLMLQATLLIALLSISPLGFAERTDLVFLHNGDRITGEVKSLHRGKLEFKTDSMGTLYIEWEDIAEIVSDIGQSVELTNGQRFYGSLGKPENRDMMLVDTNDGTVGVSITDVIAMYPVEAGFWDRLDLSASLGFSWDKGSNVGKYNIGVDAEYRNPRFITRASASTEVTTQEGRDDTSRATIEANHLVFRRNKRYHSIFGNIEKNDELGIDARGLIGAGYGWVPLRSNRNWFSVGIGLAANHEIPLEGEDETNLEAVGMLTYDYYKYSDPERSWKTSLVVFPSVTDFGRYRANFDTVFRLEFISDLFWKLDFYLAYDSEPISTKASSIDYGVTSSLEYKF